MKEYKITLNEFLFTNVCKFGFIIHQSDLGRIEIPITKRDIKAIATGELLKKSTSDNYEIILQDIGFELTKEIIKRSPMYSDLYYEL